MVEVLVTIHASDNRVHLVEYILQLLQNKANTILIEPGAFRAIEEFLSGMKSFRNTDRVHDAKKIRLVDVRADNLREGLDETHLMGKALGCYWYWE